ncbi:MAG: TonB-dependent receptor [Flavobacteriales bacterium]|nr:TonB-dependent receptor [Flavobacteriales bacterium]|tara:strand:- start:14933 stop:17182 length:2250 start_codon:yes stop_codon:yes gene_type:complete
MKTKLTFLFIFLSQLTLFAQKGSVRGFVYDKENGEAIMFCNVIIEGKSIGASTDVNGFFNITNVPVGKHTLFVTYVGYDTLRQEIVLKDKQILNQKLEISPSSVQIETVTVSADRQEMKTEVKVSVTKITPKDIKIIPAIGGEPDLAQYLQVLPGVVFTGDQGGQLYIRGGSPIQNKVLLDGMIVYNPFHSIGLFSVFDTDLMRNADIYTGGFGAQYGGRISSIMDITTKDGNKNRLAGKVSTNTFGSKLMLEGPFFKKGGNSSFIMSAKTSYLDKSSKLLYTYIDTAGLPYSYTDLYGKISVNSSNGSKWSLFGYNYRDKVSYKDVSNLGWKSGGIGSNFILVPSGNSTIIEGAFAYSSYLIRLEEAIVNPRQSGINGFNLGLNFTTFKADNELQYGLEVLGYQTDFDFTNATGLLTEQKENSTELSGFIRYKIKTNKLILDPGIRIYKYNSIAATFEPRLGAKFLATDNLRFKLAAGKYSQNLVSTNSDQDVVNLFYGFLSAPDNLPDEFKGEEVVNGLQMANHLILGLEYDISSKIDFNLEGYVKDFTQLTNINKDKLTLSDPDFIVEEGLAKGVDLVLKYNDPKFYFWLVYSLGHITRSGEDIEYNPHFDRRHNVNLVSTYKFGVQKNWSFDARWNIGSGFPFTQTQGFYPSMDFSDGINTNYTSESGELGIIYAGLNEGRLPWYHRLDIALKKEQKLSKHSTFEWNVGVTNVYNRENIFYFNRIEYKRVNQLPFMPSAGMSLSF